MKNVAEWLEQRGFEHLEGLFYEHDIGLDILCDLTDNDLKEIGVQRLGERKRLLKEIAEYTNQRARTTIERRLLSVLFCDLVGSTDLSTQLDPEDLRFTIRSYRQTVVQSVTEHGGIVASFAGDGIIAYFGWPDAVENQTQQAVRAGLDLIEQIHHLGLENNISLRCRIGIATGRVVVGGETHLDSALGETPNLAARLQTLAEPGQVLIDSATHHIVAGHFKCGAHEPVSIKGYPDRLSVWHVIGECPPLDETMGTTSALIGRTKELEHIVQLWHQARQGRTVCALVSGEPGIGKSRLVKEFIDVHRHTDMTFLRFHSSQHHAYSAFYCILQATEKAAGLDAPNDTPAAKLKKLEAWFGDVIDDFPGIRSVLTAMLDIPYAGDSEASALTAADRRQLVIDFIVAFICRLARQKPMWIIVEDIHWADPSSKATLRTVIETAEADSIPIFVLMTSRQRSADVIPQRVKAHTTLLGRLEKDDIRRIACAVEGSNTLPQTTLNQIVERAEGVPLYAEAIINAVLRREKDIDLVQIPQTLEASLTAQLDALGSAKEIAQTGSILNREFRISELSLLVDMPGNEIETAINAIISAGLLQKIEGAGETTFRFRHALIQDVAYHSMLRTRREALHGQFARYLMTGDNDRATAGIIALHLMRAGDISQAIDFWKKAGTQSAEISANTEATAQFTQALNLIGRLPQGIERDRAEFSILVAMSTPIIAEEGYTSANIVACIERASQLSAAGGNVTDLLRLLYSRWAFLLTSGSIRESLEVAQEFSRLAEEQDNQLACYARHRLLGASHMCLGHIDRSTHHLHTAIEDYCPEHHAHLTYEYGVNIRVAARCFFSEVCWAQGKSDEARHAVQLALAEAKQFEHINSIGMALHFGGLLGFLEEDYALVESYSGELMTLAKGQPVGAWPTLGQAMLGWCRFRETGKAEHWDAMLSGIEKAMAVGVSMFIPFFFCRIADELMTQGQLDEAENYLGRCDALIAKTGEVIALAEVWRLQAMVAALQGRLTDAESWLEEALSLSREQGTTNIEYRVTGSYAKLLLDNNRTEAAFKLLEPLAAAPNQPGATCVYFQEALQLAEITGAASAPTDTARAGTDQAHSQQRSRNMDTLRTPDARFARLPDFPYTPRYVELNDTEDSRLRMHYIDEGENADEVILCLHGEPSWSFLYRHMIRILVDAGYRVVAPDLIGFGRSDKPTRREDYTYLRHVEWLKAFISLTGLTNITLFCQDWGGLIGLRIVAEDGSRFKRVITANTFLPTGDDAPPEAFFQWQQYSQTVETFPVGSIIQNATLSTLSQDVLAAYDAPYPDERYKAGARQFPMLVPVSQDDPARDANRRAWKVLESFSKPWLTLFSDTDPITRYGEKIFQKRIPGARGQPHALIKNAGHFLQEDAPEEISARVAAFIAATPQAAP